MAKRDEPGRSTRSSAPHPRRRAWVEVDAGAIRRNLERIRRIAGRGVRTIPIVKCDGYGLGVENVVAALAPARPYGYGVATVAEGLELRRLGVREPVMVICPLPPRDLPRAVAASLVPTISDLASLAALTRIAAATPAPALPLPFQVEVDTGMGRAGFPLDDPAAGWWSDILHALASGLRLLGVFTHLHSAGPAP